MKKLVLGILAHVDSGKTTLSEGILYKTGEIRKWGRVDHRDTFLDTHFLEHERGITIFSKQAVFKTDNAYFTLLDTPGHVDFSTETERTLQVLDYAILVISGSEGVQSHTETLWKLLKKYNIPTFIFINKMDIASVSRTNIIENLKSKLHENCIDFNLSETDEFIESISLCNEKLMQEYLESGKHNDITISEAIADRNIFPCCFGSALKLDGIESFLQIIDKYTFEKNYPKEFSARVFKISEDEQGSRLTHLKITGGNLKVKALLKYNGTEEKINQIRIYSGKKYNTLESVDGGTICVVTGLSKTYSGQGLGKQSDEFAPVLEPVLTYRLILNPETDVHFALSSLKKLEQEDPQLHVTWNELLEEINVQLMGEIQLEIFKRIIKERFGFDADFSKGNITYRETIENKVEGAGHYEPLKHYAEVHLILEPGKTGSGLIYECNCREDLLDKNWQRLILTHLKEKQHIGVMTGSPITDIKITLASGKAHLKHTEGGDFRQATYRAVRQGLRKAKSILLEPWYQFKLEIPSENIGRAISDIQRMSGNFSSPETIGNMSVIEGSAPVSEMCEYQSEVISYSKGKGRLNCGLKGYFPCHNAEKVIEQIGYNADADTVNTADSVFCTHGAGHIVKWNEADNYMHLESCIKPAYEIPDITSAQIKRYQNTLAEDKELMEIFERTYGPIKQNKRTAFRPKKKSLSENENYKAKPLPNGPEYLLVDGYNIIFAWDNLKNLAQDNLDLARNQLINILCNYQGFSQCKLILVFDAYKIKGGKRNIEKVHNIDVVYTKEAETADMYIEKVTHEIGKNHRVRVATSDNLEQIIILGNGAFRISASEFQKEVEAIENAIREFIV